MANYYCEYCGTKRKSESSIVSITCLSHPSGPNRGNHKLYEGEEKSKYACKYCGKDSSSIAKLITGACRKHPEGANKGKHAPAL